MRERQRDERERDAVARGHPLHTELPHTKYPAAGE
jgi:hypothetical protein